MTQSPENGFIHDFVELPGQRTHFVCAGPADGYPVILLHGFPEFWYSWRFQIPALAEAGYRVIVPDQRGYNLSGKQPPYRLVELVEDITRLQDALGIARSHIAGHDWGGVVAYRFAGLYPERTGRLVALNAPHLPAYLDTVRRHPVQIVKSYYVFLFQIPRLPEGMFRQNDYRAIEAVFKSLPAHVMTQTDIQAYKTACAQPGAMSAAIGWYRANFNLGEMVNRHEPGAGWQIDRPALVIWGEKDPFLDKRCNETLPAYTSDLSIRYFPEAGHWIHMEQFCAVSSLMIEFFSAV